MVHIYYGEGKGKTTAAAGLALRAAGRGKRVFFLQFMKGSPSGEIAAMESIPHITVLRDDRPWKFSWNMDEREKAEAAQRTAALFDRGAGAAKAGEMDLLVLDEALGACKGGFLAKEGLTDLMLHCKRMGNEGPELVITGRDCFPEAMALADYATEMRKEKHPFDEGTPAREGIEY